MDDEIICPHCGKQQEEKQEMRGSYDGDRAYWDCQFCEQGFILETHITFKFTTMATAYILK